MKTILLLAASLMITAGFMGCSTAANNGNNANIRGTNTNTGYVANSEANAKPTIPANSTNITPPNMNSKSNTNAYGVSNSNSKTNTKKP